MARSMDLKSSAVRITRPSRRWVSICCWTSWISARISARRSRGCCEVSSGFRRWLGLRLGMVVPLATGVSGNDDYQRACGRRETPLQGTVSFGSLPRVVVEEFGSDRGDGHVARAAAMTDPAEDIPGDGPLGQGEGDLGLGALGL